MASGGKELVINPQERALSVDVNRLQKFSNFDRAELLRLMLDVTTSDDLDAAGVIVDHETDEAPLRAEVINGLMVRPQNGSLALLVDPGILCCIQPDSAPDDSNYKFVDDAGVPLAGTIAMTANSSGSTRVDVVECQINTSPGASIVETDNRDIFNEVTGLFVATSVTKAVASQLVYRVRAGTPAGGYPGNAQDWLPIMVASVPTGSTNCDTMTFWDVRPLVSDREFQPFANASSRPKNLWGKIQAAGSTTRISGDFTSVHAGRRLGGRIRSSFSVDADNDYLTYGSAANQEASFTLVANRPWYLYALQPFGLPRWARYTASTASNRVPKSPRGLMVVSMQHPDPEGRPGGNIPLPSAFGAGSTNLGVCVAAGWVDNAGAMQGFWANDGEHRLKLPVPNPGVTWGTLSAGDAPMIHTGSNTVTAGFLTSAFALQAGVDFPANAKRLLVYVVGTINIGNGGANVMSCDLGIYAPNGSLVTQVPAQAWGFSTHGSASTEARWFERWVEMYPSYPATTDPAFTMELDTVWGANGFIQTTGNTVKLAVLGWKL